MPFEGVPAEKVIAWHVEYEKRSRVSDEHPTGEDAERLRAKPASAARNAGTPKPPTEGNNNTPEINS